MSKEENYIYESFEIDQNHYQDKQRYIFFVKSKNMRIKLIVSLSLIILGLILFISFYLKKNHNKKISHSILLDLDNYSFKAKYHTDSENEKVTLFRNTSFEIKEMIIDGEKIEPSLEYNFASTGDHVIYVLLDISKTNSLHGMFSGITKLTSISFSPLFDTKNIQLMGYMFYGAESLAYVDFSNFNTEKVTNMDNMFLGCSSLTSLDLSSFSTKNVKFMVKMFSGCKSLTSIDLSNFDTPNLTKMSYMFSGCSSLKKIILSNFNTELVTDMEGLFFDCSSLISIDLSSFNTKNVVNMGNMFYKCSKLVAINLLNFNTIKVLNLENMFYSCSSLTYLDISKFNTQKVKLMNNMFYGCSSINSLDLSNFDTENVKNMNEMFYGCTKLNYLDISSFKYSYSSKISILGNNNPTGRIKVNDSFLIKIKDEIPSTWDIETVF